MVEEHVHHETQTNDLRSEKKNQKEDYERDDM